jgi:hypothetical protein
VGDIIYVRQSGCDQSSFHKEYYRYIMRKKLQVLEGKRQKFDVSGEAGRMRNEQRAVFSFTAHCSLLIPHCLCS